MLKSKNYVHFYGATAFYKTLMYTLHTHIMIFILEGEKVIFLFQVN